MAESQDPQESAGTITAEQLCAITGLTDRRHRQLATAGYFPPPILGRYQVGKTLVGVIRYQRELIQKKSNKLAKEQIALTKARRETAQEELAVMRGEYVEKAVIGPALRNVSLHQRAVLQRVLEQEVAPNLTGLTPIEVVGRMKRAVDEICATFREGTAGWLDKPPEQEPEPGHGLSGDGSAADTICPGPEADPLQSSPSNCSEQPPSPASNVSHEHAT